MFAHQVIEDLIEVSGLQINTDIGKSILSIADSIKKSQKFHFGSLSEMINIDKRSHGKVLFAGNKEDHLKLPYDICWFDFHEYKESIVKSFSNKEKITKFGVLCSTGQAGIVHMIVFNYYSMSDRWTPSMVEFIVKIDGNYDGTTHNVYCAPLTYEVEKSLKRNKVSIADIVGQYNGELTALSASISMLNCKNITTKKETASRRVNLKRKKKGKVPLFDYHTLRLQLPSKSTKSIGGKPTGETKRLHLCRGHFKTYTKDAPLLGRFTGRYWWEPHVRGDKKRGIVMKDYDIKAV